MQKYTLLELNAISVLTLSFCKVTNSICDAYLFGITVCHKTTYYLTIISRLVLVIKYFQSSTVTIIVRLILGIEHIKYTNRT